MRYPALWITSNVDIGHLLHDSRAQLIDQIVLALHDCAAVSEPAVQGDRRGIDGRHVGHTRPPEGIDEVLPIG